MKSGKDSIFAGFIAFLTMINVEIKELFRFCANDCTECNSHAFLLAFPTETLYDVQSKEPSGFFRILRFG